MSHSRFSIYSLVVSLAMRRWGRLPPAPMSSDLRSRGPRPAAGVPDVFEQEREQAPDDEACRSGNGQVQGKARPGVALGRHRPVQYLDNREVSGLDHPRLLELLGQECDQGLLYLHVPGEPREFHTDLRDLREGHGEVTLVVIRSRGHERGIPVLQPSKLTSHFFDAAPDGDHLRIRLGREVAHDLKLNVRGHDVRLEPCRDLDGPPRLFLQGDRLVALLEAPELALRHRERGLGSRQLLRQEYSLAPPLTGSELGEQAVKLLRVEVRHLGRNTRVGVSGLDTEMVVDL